MRKVYERRRAVEFLYSVYGKTSTMSDYKSGSEAAEECSICLEPLEEQGPPMRTLECMHTFHNDCVQGWLQKCSSCPVCRTELSLFFEVPRPTLRSGRSRSIQEILHLSSDSSDAEGDSPPRPSYSQRKARRRRRRPQPVPSLLATIFSDSDDSSEDSIQVYTESSSDSEWNSAGGGSGQSRESCQETMQVSREAGVAGGTGIPSRGPAVQSRVFSDQARSSTTQGREKPESSGSRTSAFPERSRQPTRTATVYSLRSLSMDLSSAMARIREQDEETQAPSSKRQHTTKTSPFPERSVQPTSTVTSYSLRSLGTPSSSAVNRKRERGVETQAPSCKRRQSTLKPPTVSESAGRNRRGTEERNSTSSEKS